MLAHTTLGRVSARVLSRCVSSSAGPKMHNGKVIPSLGIGTWGSDTHSADTIAAAVDTALGMGYKHVDCASVYGNQNEIRPVLKRHSDKPIHVTSKLWNDDHTNVRHAYEETCEQLGVRRSERPSQSHLITLTL